MVALKPGKGRQQPTLHKTENWKGLLGALKGQALILESQVAAKACTIGP